MKRNRMILGTLVASMLLASIAVAAPSSLSIDRWVMSGGGGSATAGSTTLDGAIGQWVVGSGTKSGKQLGSGFFGGGELADSESHSIYLPLVPSNTP
jgi:hypothetical protein